MSKISRIVLVILVIVAVAFVASFFLRDKSASPVSVAENTDNTQVVVQLADGRQCYTYSHAATTEAPYTVSEFIDMTITDGVVTGTKKGTQAGPDMTNGYEGTITGTLSNNTITDIFSYTIEGSQNKEKEIYRASVVGIEKLRYPLTEAAGILVPVTTEDFQVLSYVRIGCEALN
jgi:hypothetical protein